MFVTQLVNSGMNRPKRFRNRTIRLAKKCRIRIWKQPLALDKNLHLTSLGHKKKLMRKRLHRSLNSLSRCQVKLDFEKRKKQRTGFIMAAVLGV